MQAPAWQRTLLVWTFDEGGYYDHVPPSAAVPPDDIPPLPPAPSYDGFARYGFRVPAVVVSAWSRPGHVTSVTHDHTSTLAMLERKWNLPAMTDRDAAADLTDFLDLNQPAFAEPPPLSPPLAGPGQIRCESSGPGQIPPLGPSHPDNKPRTGSRGLVFTLLRSSWRLWRRMIDGFQGSLGHKAEHGRRRP